MLVYQRVLSIFNMQCCIHLYPKYADPFRADLWQEFERKFREQNVPRAPADADLPPGSKGRVGRVTDLKCARNFQKSKK
jgi:hypothetical protein